MPVELSPTRFPGLFRSGTGIYYGRFRARGREVRRSLKTRKLGVARMALARMQDEEGAGEPFSRRGDDGSWRRVLEEWGRRQLARRDIADHTRFFLGEDMKRLLERSLPLEVEVGEWSKADARSWYETLTAGFAASTTNQALSALRGCIKVALEWGLVGRDVTEELKRRRSARKQLVICGNEEMASIIASIRGQDLRFSEEAADMVAWMAYSGIRVGDARSLRWELVRQDSFTVPASKTNSGVRSVPIMGALREVVDRRRQKHGPVFLLLSPHQALEGACKRLSLPRMTPHDLRHWFATRCLEQGVDPPTLAMWLGHKDRGELVMRTYGHVREAHGLELAKRIEL